LPVRDCQLPTAYFLFFGFTGVVGRLVGFVAGRVMGFGATGADFGRGSGFGSFCAFW